VAPALDARLGEACGRHDSVYTVESYDVACHLATWLTAHPTATRAQVCTALRQPFAGLGGEYRFDACGERVEAAIGIYRDEPEGLRYLGSDGAVLA
jgi:ABC-type branched-subunit amino acid transport system substrate-binding protein